MLWWQMFSTFAVSHGKDYLLLRHKSFTSESEERFYITQVLGVSALHCSAPLSAQRVWFILLTPCCAVQKTAEYARVMLIRHMLRFSSADACRQAVANGELDDPAELARAFMFSRACAARSLDVWYDPLPC